MEHVFIVPNGANAVAILAHVLSFVDPYIPSVLWPIRRYSEGLCDMAWMRVTVFGITILRGIFAFHMSSRGLASTKRNGLMISEQKYCLDIAYVLRLLPYRDPAYSGLLRIAIAYFTN